MLANLQDWLRPHAEQPSRIEAPNTIETKLTTTNEMITYLKQSSIIINELIE